MTFEELKAEASRQGYSLTKKIVYEKLKPCVCGSKRVYRELSFPNKSYYQCAKCGKSSEEARTIYQARANWNKFVEENSQNTEKTLDNHDC